MRPVGLVTMANGSAISLEELPRLELDAFRDLVIAAPRRGRRVSALFGAPVAGPKEHRPAQGAGRLGLYVVLADDDAGLLECAWTELAGESFPR